jgi:sec-independent protein translocase protein TatC
MATDEKTAALVAHLRELRRRLIISIAAIVVGFAVCYTFSDDLYVLLARPLMPHLPPGSDFIAFTGVVEPFFIYLKVGFLGGAVLASPVLLFETWAFVAPGLYSKERYWFIAVVFASLTLFLVGVFFAYLVVFPFGFKYLLSFSSDELKPILSMGSYFSLVTRLLIAFGLVYQLPLAMLVIARLGIMSAAEMLSWWRYAIVLIFLASALITPTPDIFNQLLMAGPLLVLYASGLVLAKVFGRKKEEEDEEAEDGKKEN